MRPCLHLGPKPSSDVALCHARAGPRNRRNIDPGSLGAYKASEPTHDHEVAKPVWFWGAVDEDPVLGDTGLRADPWPPHGAVRRQHLLRRGAGRRRDLPGYRLRDWRP